MDIEFPGPAVPAQDGGISYRALVDGETVVCKFSMEALQDIDPSLTESPPIEQFEASMNRLLSIAEKKIREEKVENDIVQIFTADLRS